MTQLNIDTVRKQFDEDTRNSKVDQSSVTSKSLMQLEEKFGSFPQGKMLAALMCASEQINLHNASPECAAEFTLAFYKVRKKELVQWLHQLEAATK